MKERVRQILHELQHHFPLTLLSSVVVMLFLGTFNEVLVRQSAHAHDGAHEGAPFVNLFHLFHPLHIFLSSITTAAMFWRYDRRFGMAVLTGIVGSVGFCGLSDAVFPFFGSRLLGAPMDLHICVLEHPGLVWPFAAVGVLAGVAAAHSFQDPTVTRASHALHVLVSTTASILYLVGYGFADWTSHPLEVMIILVCSVLIPCCSSDIVFPLLLVNKAGVHWCLGACHQQDRQEGK